MELVVFFRSNVDVFASNAYEAPGVDASLICHHLNVNPQPSTLIPKPLNPQPSNPKLDSGLKFLTSSGLKFLTRVPLNQYPLSSPHLHVRSQWFFAFHTSPSYGLMFSIS